MPQIFRNTHRPKRAAGFSAGSRIGLKTFGFFSLLLCSPLAARAADINIQKKDGTAQLAAALRREKDNIVATIDIPPAKPGDAAQTRDVAIPLAQIAKIEFGEPAALKTAPDLFIQAKGDEALAQIDAALKYYEGFRDAPGSWWADLLLMKMNALVSLGREPEADALAESMSRQSTDPEAQRAAKVLLAAAAVRKGDAKAGAETLDAVMKEATKSDVLAAAAIYKGQSCLVLKDWENALLSFLQVPVLYPEQKALAPASMLGVARAHFGLEDFPLAKSALKELIKTYKGTPEAVAAKVEMENIVKREKALADPTTPKDAVAPK